MGLLLVVMVDDILILSFICYLILRMFDITFVFRCSRPYF